LINFFLKIPNLVFLATIICSALLCQTAELQAKPTSTKPSTNPVTNSNSTYPTSKKPTSKKPTSKKVANTGQIQFIRPTLPPGNAPGGRRTGGGRRDSCPDMNPKLTALVPVTEADSITNVWGLTSAERPTFWFYLPYTKSSKYPTEFILQDSDGETKHQVDITLPEKPGIISVSIPKSVTPLAIGKQYRWFLKVYCNEQKKSLPIYVEGVINRVNLNAIATQQLRTATPQQQVAIYAQNGIWYQALATLLELRQNNPKDETLQNTWETLLTEIGLIEIADKPLIN
jgi:Domain of Unknown Function (DUF928)